MAIVVRIAFASDAFTGSPSWTDVSSYLVSYSLKRGRQNELDRMEAGEPPESPAEKEPSSEE